MKKEFYIWQPLVVKETGERAVLLSDDGKSIKSISAWNGNERIYWHSDDLEPSTEFKFSEIIAGLEQGYFEVGTEFIMTSTNRTVIVKQGNNGLYLQWPSGLLVLTSIDISSTWILVESRKEMTLEEIEAELGYKIKLKDKID